MFQVLHDANFRLMWRTKWVFVCLSSVALMLAIGVMVFRGFNFGIDFAGGTSVQVKFREKPSVQDLRAALEAAQLGDISIQSIGSAEDNEVLIRVERHAPREGGAGSEGGEISSRILEALSTATAGATPTSERIDLNMASEVTLRDWLAPRLSSSGAVGSTAPEDAGPDAIAQSLIRYRNDRGGLFHDMSEVLATPGLPPEAAGLLEEQGQLGDFALRAIDFVGPTAGRELLHKTALAIFFSVAGILVYVWFRFHKVAWGVASIVALVHDVTLAAGAMALSGKEFSLPVVAALLTILGYSINDTIVVFDRIRENLRLYRDLDFEVVVNGSVNQTLSRTALTSFTLFVAVTALFLYGGDKLNPLSFCLMVGVFVGTYSSIFVASSTLVIAYRLLGPKAVKA